MTTVGRSSGAHCRKSSRLISTSPSTSSRVVSFRRVASCGVPCEKVCAVDYGGGEKDVLCICDSFSTTLKPNRRSVCEAAWAAFGSMSVGVREYHQKKCVCVCVVWRTTSARDHYALAEGSPLEELFPLEVVPRLL
jgi:hypothetical protein